MEHLAFNIKNIKESLHRMQKYILGKSINSDEANNVKDIEGVRKVAWRFITAFYESHWNGLLVDGTNRSFRNNIKSKFSPQIIKENNSNKDENLVNTLYIFSLSSPILAKTTKEINEIFKYFLKNSQNTARKSYVQASANPTNISNIARNTLKIIDASRQKKSK